jgi:hypothetical protein
MDRQKDERISYHNGIWDVRGFGESESQKLSFIQPLFCPET